MKRMVLLAALAMSLSSCSPAGPGGYTACYGAGRAELRIATGSPGELGLLKVLAEEFARTHDARVLWQQAGTGESLQLLHDRRVDAIMVHAPQAEEKAVSEGWATGRTLIGSNEFYLVGPASDPAAVRSASTIVDAYQRIARQGARFFSRADNSGTHQKEMAVWKRAGTQPDGDWYIRTRTFMTATLLRADAEQGYFMTDSSTWVAARSKTAGLRLLFKGDPFIVNVYHAYCVPPGATPNAALAARFAEFLAGPKAQALIRQFGKESYGEPIYNDADYARQYEPVALQNRPTNVVRVAVIGGMTMTGVWQEVSRMFEAKTGYKVEVVKTAQRPFLAEVLRAGEVDLLTMHSGDITTNLVVDGYGIDIRPWTQNELVIVGPANDPAKIRGLHDGAEAFRRIAATQANFVDFEGIGSREVCHSLWKRARIQPKGDWLLKDESADHMDVLNFAANRNAYVVVGRMPVLFDKLKARGMEILVQNDPAMRRPYMVMQANPARFPQTNVAGAKALEEFLLSDQVQQWLAKGATNQRGETPLFFPISNLARGGN